MSCGCGGNKSGNCSSNVTKLKSYKKQIQTLITTTKDAVLKEGYEQKLIEIDSLLISENVCPDKIVLNYFKVYVLNEYSKLKN